jgi:hypothetical protein
MSVPSQLGLLRDPDFGRLFAAEWVVVPWWAHYWQPGSRSGSDTVRSSGSRHWPPVR